MFPCASRTLMPYCAMVFAASLVGAISCSMAFLSAVPASLPVRPTFVSIAKLAIRSAVLCPVALNAKPACLKPSERSVMLAALAFAPAASWSAISVACSPERPKAFSAPETTCAAVAASVSAAAASCSVPLAASMVSVTLRPALESSSMAVAASDADAPGSVISLPSATAMERISSIWAAVAPDAACSTFRFCSKSPAAVIAEPTKPVTAPAARSSAPAIRLPAAIPPTPSRSMPCWAGPVWSTPLTMMFSV